MGTNTKMYYTRFFYTLLLLTGLFNYCRAQNQSNTGMDFWLGYGAHAAMFNNDGSVNNTTGGSQQMCLYLKCPSGGPADVTVTIPATGWTKTVVVSGFNNQVIIPKTGLSDARLTGEGVFNNGIHISSNLPITAFAHIYDVSGSAETLLVPVEILEQDYYVIGFKQAAQESNSFSYCFVVATEDSTTVEVIPSADTRSHSANVPFTQLLLKGQVLNLIGKTTGNAGGIITGNDLTGTVIRTVGAGNDTLCKKIAVFSGSSNTLISCGQDSGTGDNLFQQVLPTRAWGSTFITVPTAGMAMNYYRVYTNNSSTSVSVNGQQLSGRVNGTYFQFQCDTAALIRASAPVVVAQYITSAGACGNTGLGNEGDPDMVFLTPVNLALNSVSTYFPQVSNITNSYVNVVLQTAIVDSFKIDSFHKDSFFSPLSYDSMWSYAQIPVTPGPHVLSTDSLAFTAIAYGYGPNESYAFNTGFNIANLSYIKVHNPYLTPPANYVCRTIPFKISFSIFNIPESPVELTFDFKNNPYLTPNNIVDTLYPVADSANVNAANDTTLWHYTLPATYTYALDGPSSFNVYITMLIPTPEGCIEQRTVTYPVYVSAKPVTGISLTYDSCSLDAFRLQARNLVAGDILVNWLWDFGDSTAASNQNAPLKKYANYGDYTVKLRSITNIGCFADTFKTISLNPKPTAVFGYSGNHCTLDSLSFTDSSSVLPPWAIVTRAWDFGDGTTSGATNPVKQYTTGGSFKAMLITYTNANCTDTSFKIITISGGDTLKEFITVKNKYPGTDTPTVCRSEPFTLSATFSGRPLQIHWDFSGNPNLTPNNNVDLLTPVPDSMYFNGQDSFFRYSLPYIYTYTGIGQFNLNVEIFTLTNAGCLAPVVYNNTIQGVGKPQANWALNYDRCANDTLYFINQSTSPGASIISWKWAFGDNTASSDTNPVKKYAAFGEYPVSLNIITDVGCYADTTSPISLSPKPVASFGIIGTLFCPNSPLNFDDSSSIAAPGKLTEWLWDFGDGSSSNLQNTSMQYSATGSYNITLMVFSDHNCIDTLAKTIVIYPIPVIALQPEVYINVGGPYPIVPAYTGIGLEYMWTPPDALNSDSAAYPITVTEKNVVYTVTATGDGGCQATSSIKIVVGKLIKVPNAFSPNGDGINDKWVIENIQYFPDCSVRIFNRYGQIVFSSTGYSIPWDGTFNGKPLPVGTYYYIIDTKVAQYPGQAGYVELLR